MPTHMPMHNSIRTALCLLALLPAAAAAADDHRFTRSADSALLYNVDFAGGSAAEFLDGFRGVAENFRIVVAGNLNQHEMPPVQIDRLTGSSILELLDTLAPGVSVSSSGGSSIQQVGGAAVEESWFFMVTAEPRFRESAQAKTFDLSFPGGNALEYIEAIGLASGQSRIVAMEGVENYWVPRVELSGVSLEGAVDVINQGPTQPGGGDNREIRLGVSHRNGGVMVVEPVLVSGKGWAESQAQLARTNVWSISELLSTGLLEPDDVLSAIDIALSLELGDHDAVIRYHAETDLLMSRAHTSSLKIVDTVLERLEETAFLRAQHEQRLREIRVELEALDAEEAAVAMELEVLVARQAQSVALVESGHSPAHEPLEFAVAAERTKAEQAQLEARHEILVDEFARIERYLDQHHRDDDRWRDHDRDAEDDDNARDLGERRTGGLRR